MAIPDPAVETNGKMWYSVSAVPTRFGITSVPSWEFDGWPVHLLGGSPHPRLGLDVHERRERRWQHGESDGNEKMRIDWMPGNGDDPKIATGLICGMGKGEKPAEAFRPHAKTSWRRGVRWRPATTGSTPDRRNWRITTKFGHRGRARNRGRRTRPLGRNDKG